MLSKLYRGVDIGGRLSDIIADPQRIWERWRVYSYTRRKLLRIDDPVVSVIIATRNNGDTIELSIRSIQMQSLPNIEIVVIDDASSDDTRLIVKRIQKSDPRVRYFANHEQRGIGRSRNRGLGLATGTYVTFQDGDDVSHPLRMQKQLAPLLKSDHAKVTYCNYARITSTGKRLAVNDVRIRRCVISMMFRRKEMIETVGFFTGESISEDSDYSERISLAFGKDSAVNVFRTLYEALYRPTSTFFSHGSAYLQNSLTVQFQPNDDLLNSIAEMNDRHERMRAGAISFFSPYCD